MRNPQRQISRWPDYCQSGWPIVFPIAEPKKLSGLSEISTISTKPLICQPLVFTFVIVAGDRHNRCSSLFGSVGGCKPLAISWKGTRHLGVQSGGKAAEGRCFADAPSVPAHGGGQGSLRRASDPLRICGLVRCVLLVVIYSNMTAKLAFGPSFEAQHSKAFQCSFEQLGRLAEHVLHPAVVCACPWCLILALCHHLLASARPGC